MKPMGSEDLMNVMREYFKAPVLPPGTYTCHVSVGFTYEGQRLTVYSIERDMYWQVTVTAKAIDEAETFGDAYGKSITELRDFMWTHEETFRRGYH